MNLRFQTVEKKFLGEKTYLVQKAEIEDRDKAEFWSNWKAPDSQLKKFLSLRKEQTGFVVYRLLPEHSNLPINVFSQSYHIKNSKGLLKYQIRAVEGLCNAVIHHGSACDGSDTGLGKTYTALATCREMNMIPAIVCAKPGIDAWKKGCVHFKIRPLFIVNWEIAKLDRFPYTRRYITRENVWNDEKGGYVTKDTVKAFTWHLKPRVMLIFDEAHMGNHNGSQNNMLYLAAKDHHTLSLSATFGDKPERLSALLTVLKAIDRDSFKSWLETRGQFTDKYNNTRSVSVTDNMLEISKFLYPEYGYRMRYTDPDVKSMFPEAVNRALIINISEKQKKEQNELYLKLVKKIMELKAKGLAAEAIVADLRYRQATELMKADTLCAMAKNLLTQAKTVFVFVNFRDTLSYICKKMKTKAAIYGGQPDKIRSQLLDSIGKNKTKFAVIMVGAGGQSIDLHDTIGNSPRISLIAPTYNAIQCKQVLGRIYRAGSKSTPVNMLVYAGGTVEEKVAESVNAKIANISALQDGDLMEPDLFQLGISHDN